MLKREFEEIQERHRNRDFSAWERDPDVPTPVMNTINEMSDDIMDLILEVKRLREENDDLENVFEEYRLRLR